MPPSPNPTNWRPLIELIPAIERTRQFGAYPGPVQLAENLSVFSGLSNAEIAGEFMRRAYDNGLIHDFDRLCREAGKPVLQNRPGFNLSN